MVFRQAFRFCGMMRLFVLIEPIRDTPGKT
jgi:hypothetical protein